MASSSVWSARAWTLVVTEPALAESLLCFLPPSGLDCGWPSCGASRTDRRRSSQAAWVQSERGPPWQRIALLARQHGALLIINLAGASPATAPPSSRRR
jgi:hypothetical protein